MSTVCPAKGEDDVSEEASSTVKAGCAGAVGSFLAGCSGAGSGWGLSLRKKSIKAGALRRGGSSRDIEAVSWLDDRAGAGRSPVSSWIRVRFAGLRAGSSSSYSSSGVGRRLLINVTGLVPVATKRHAAMAITQSSTPPPVERAALSSMASPPENTPPEVRARPVSASCLKPSMPEPMG